MSNDKPTQEPSRIETEQALRQMNDDWVKALVRADGATLEGVMADDFFFAYPMEGDDKAQFIGDVISGDVKVDLKFISSEIYHVGTAPYFGRDRPWRGRGKQDCVVIA